MRCRRGLAFFLSVALLLPASTGLGMPYHGEGAAVGPVAPVDSVTLAAGRADEPYAISNPEVITASFSLTPTSGCGAPLTVYFTDESTGGSPIMTRTWNLAGSPWTVTETVNPTYTYTMTGDYTVWLTVTNEVESDSVSHTLSVYPLPQASFTHTPTAGPAPLTVYFTATGSNVLTPTWDLGDTTARTAWVVQHTYSQTGAFTVTMTATSTFGCGQVVDTAVVTVTPEMVLEADFVAAPMTSCGAPATVHFTDTSEANPPIEAWFWDLDDGSTATETNPTHIYTTIGDFVVTLWVTDTAGESDAISHTISVYAQPTAAFTYTLQDHTVTFTNTSAGAGSFWWDFGDGSTSTQTHPIHTYTKAGHYAVMLQAIDACTDSAGLEVTVEMRAFLPLLAKSYQPPDWYPLGLAGRSAYVALASNTSLVIGSDDGVYRQDGCETEPIAIGLAGRQVRSLVNWPDGGGLYAGTIGEGVWRQDGATWIAVNQGLGNLKVWDLEVGPDNKLYAATDGGVFVLTLLPPTTWVPMIEGLAGSALLVNDVVFDSTGLYIATWGSGAYHWDVNKWLPLGQEGLAGDALLVWSLVVDTSSIYLGTGNGIYESTDAGLTWSPAALSGTHVTDFLDDGGQLYAASWQQGTYVLSQDSGTWLPLGEMEGSSAYVYRLTMYAACSRLVAGTYDGAWSYFPWPR